MTSEINWNVLEALATSLAVIVAAIAVVFSARQTVWVKRTVLAMESDGKTRDEFEVKKSRAYICITSTSLGWSRTFNEDGDIITYPVFRVQFANFGATPAHGIRSFIWTWMEPYEADYINLPLPDWTESASKKSTLGPKDEDFCYVDGNSNFFKEVSEYMKTPLSVRFPPEKPTGEIIYFYGKITYLDVYNIERSTEFRYVQKSDEIGKHGIIETDRNENIIT